MIYSLEEFQGIQANSPADKCKCSKCQEVLDSSQDKGPSYCEGCYYDALSDIIEQYPVGSPGVKR